jgi:non-canonical purine NTP pyrophosphatase (RdgB/HAM1 family)
MSVCSWRSDRRRRPDHTFRLRSTAASAGQLRALGVCTADGAYVVDGRTEGTIAEHPRSTGGFGWDAIFVPAGDTRTFGEMTAEEKGRIAHRRRAWDKRAASLGSLSGA